MFSLKLAGIYHPLGTKAAKYAPLQERRDQATAS